MKTIHLTLVLLVLLCPTLKAQEKENYYLIEGINLERLNQSDSLILENSLKKYHNATTDTGRARALKGICENMMDQSWTSYQFYQHELLLTIFTTKGSDKNLINSIKSDLASSYNNVGFIYAGQGKPAVALKHYYRSLKFRNVNGNESEQKQRAATFSNIGLLLVNQGKYSEALNHYHKSLSIHENINNEHGKANVFNNLGIVYAKQNDHVQSIKYYKKCLDINKKVDNKKDAAAAHHNIAIEYKRLEKYKLAIQHYESSLELLEQINNKRDMGSVLSSLGVLYEVQGKRDKALELFYQSEQIHLETNNAGGLIITRTNLARSLHQKGELALARIKADQAFELANKIASPFRIQESARVLHEIASKEKKWKEALQMHEIFVQIRDSLTNEKNQKAAARQVAKYEYEKQKAIDDAEHEKQIAIEKEEKTRQKIISLAVGIGLLLVVVFLAFVFNRLRLTRKQKLVIEQQKETVEKAHEELEEVHKEITDSINYAERIQRSFLATDELLSAHLDEYFVFFQPKEAVSGDFYWAGELANGNFAMVNADSTGHGVPGAIMSILNISSIEKAVEKGFCEPSDIFNYTRKTIIERLKKDGSTDGGKDGMDASIICFDFAKNCITYTAANNPIWVIRDGEVIQFKPEKMPVGKHDNDQTPFTQNKFKLKKGDQIYTLTDGFQDQFGGPKGKKYMVKRMREYVLSVSHLSMNEQHQKIKSEFNNWKQDVEQIDDVCVIGVRI